MDFVNTWCYPLKTGGHDSPRRLLPVRHNDGHVSRSIGGTLIPFGFVAEAGSGVATGRPVGSTPYLGETSMEMQFLDGASGDVLAECRDTQIGRKYAAEVNSGADGAATTWANGYLSSFQAWSYAKNAFDKWAMLLAKRFGQLRDEQVKAE